MESLEAQIYRLYPPSLAAALRSKRQSLGCSQELVAKQLGVRTQTISGWERGKTPQGRHFDGLAKFLGLSGPEQVAALVRGEEGEPPPQTDEARVRRPDVVAAITRYVAGVSPGRELREDEVRFLDRLLQLAVGYDPLSDGPTSEATEVLTDPGDDAGEG